MSGEDKNNDGGHVECETERNYHIEIRSEDPWSPHGSPSIH